MRKAVSVEYSEPGEYHIIGTSYVVLRTSSGVQPGHVYGSHIYAPTYLFWL